MPINFPDAPTVGDVYTFSNRSWTWSGSVWTPNRPQYSPDRDIVTDGDGYLVVSDVTSTEISYLDGVTSNVQTQLDTKALLTDPAFVGTPTAPTAAADTTDTQLATTGFVIGQAAVATPIVNGSAAVGVSKKYARADHVHPTDATRAPLASPIFTGDLTVSASGITFTDGPQTKQGVPSLSTIKPVISANATTSTLTNALTYRDAITAIGGAFSVTIDPDTTNGVTFPIGTSIDFYQSLGAGGASFIAGATVNLLATPGLIFRDLYSSATITKVAANTWLVYGDLSA